MTEPTITCPKCHSEIKLTESLAAPLVESVKRDYEQRLAKKDADMTKRESAVREQEDALATAKEAIDDQVADRVRLERTKIAAEEAKKAKLASADDLDQKSRELAELQDVVKVQNAKLAEAQNAQAELIKKQRELDDAKREFELTVQKRIQEGLATTRQEAKKEAEDELNLKVKERDQTITSMQQKIEELKRRAEQGSQQLQGEVQELELEAMLREKFPRDIVEPVPKGEFGGDVVHQVNGHAGQVCGKILWESKRTKAWSDGWLAKLREDQRTAKADLAVIVSQALPKDVESFDWVGNVWVVHPRMALPVAIALRQSLIEVSMARKASEGQQTKTELVYQYLTGPRFIQRVQAIVEAFSSMQDELATERKVITKQWAKREEQIARVMQATVGMYGDLQGIAGKTLQEIEGLEMRVLESGPDEK